jgi:hypothetical protein
MKTKLKPFAVSAWLLALAAGGLSATLPAAAAERQQTAPAYEEIYLVQPSKDPRNVFPRVIREFKDMGYQVHVVNEQRFLGKAEGTGFLVSKTGHLLTAAHVLEGQKTATVWLDGTRYEADLVDQDAKNDLAMLKLRTNAPLAVAPLSFSREAALSLGSDIYTVGHGVGHASTRADSARLSKGMVSALASHDGSDRHVQFSSDRRLGSSGAPLLNADGAVIGMVQKTSSRGHEADAHHLALRGEQITDYVRTVSADAFGELSFDRSGSMEQAARAVAKVKSGVAADGSQDKPRLVATVDYTTFTDKHPRFGDFKVTVADLDTNQVVATAGEGSHNVARSEESVIRSTFGDVRSALGK